MDSPHELRGKARRYRKLASTITDARAIEAALDLASQYEALAADLEAEIHSAVADDQRPSQSQRGPGSN